MLGQSSLVTVGTRVEKQRMHCSQYYGCLKTPSSFKLEFITASSAGCFNVMLHPLVV
jgi:hypothetical protein